MKGKLLLVAGLISLTLSIISLAVASQDSVLAEYSGERAYSSYPVVYEANGSVILRQPPRYATVYIAVRAEEPLKLRLENELSERIRRLGLRPVVVGTDGLLGVQLKGRFLFVYITSTDERSGILSRTVEVNALAYYSTAGNVVDFLNALRKYAGELSPSDTEKLMEKVSRETEMNMDMKGIPGDAVFIYWKGLRATSGVLTDSDPYAVLIDYITNDIINGMHSVEASE